MTSFSLPLSSLLLCFPTSSVPYLGLRSPPAPPPEPLSPATPPEPPDPPDPQICSSSGETHAQSQIFQHPTSRQRVPRDSGPPSPSPPTPTEPPEPPDPQIRPSSGDAHTQLLFLQTGSQRVHRDFEPPFRSPLRSVPRGQKFVPPVIVPPPPRCSSRPHHRMLLTPCASNVTLGFQCLGLGLSCLLGQNWRTLLLGRKWRVYLLGLMIPTLSPIFSPYRSRFISVNRSRFKPSPLIQTRLDCSFNLSRSACSFAVLVTIPLPLLFPQVSSVSSLSDSSTVGSYWMDVESVALALWNSGLVITLSMIVDSRGSIFVLSRGIFIALVRPFTAICSPFTAICSPLTAICRLYFGLAPLGVALLQIGQRFLSSFTVPVILVRRGFHSPHLSFTELILLPNTPLVFSGIVIGSLVIKTVLLEAEARIVVQDGSRSAFVDGLTSEALFPPPCGFGKDYRFEDVCFIDSPCLVSALVELVSSPLSLSLYLSFVVVFNLSLYSITMLVDVLDGSVLCNSFVSFLGGG